MAAICDRIKCLGAARWMPVLQLRAKGYGGPPAIAAISLTVCNVCRHKIGLDDLITDEGWTMLCASFKAQGKVMPARKLTKIRWKEVPNVQDN